MITVRKKIVEKMKTLYPFFEFIWKTPAEKSHIKSMNLIQTLVKTKYWLHLEDDHLFFDQKEYITPAIEIFEIEDPKVTQILFNKNYIEVETRMTKGGYPKKLENGFRYLIHQYLDSKDSRFKKVMEETDNSTSVPWPNYSLRPGLTKSNIFDLLGPYVSNGMNMDSTNGSFELLYATKYTNLGLSTAFFDTISHLHTGKLTFAHDGSRNAYLLNSESIISEDEFEFRPNLDSGNNDIEQIKGLTISEQKERALANPNCVCFNTYGFLKFMIKPELQEIKNEYHHTDGLYIKKKINFRYKSLLVVNETNNTLGLKYTWDQIVKEEELEKYLENEKSGIDFYIILKNTTYQVPNFVFYLNLILHRVQYLDFDILYLGYNFKTKHVDKHQNEYCRTHKINDLKIQEFNAEIASKDEPFACLVHRNYILKKSTKNATTLKQFELKPHIVYDTHNFQMFDSYYFFPFLDSKYGDITQIKSRNLLEIKEAADENTDCVAFNTYGYLKSEVSQITFFITIKKNIHLTEGLYIKKNLNWYQTLTKSISSKFTGKIWCINLEYRKDRRDYMRKQFEAELLEDLELGNLKLNGFEFYKAVDKNKLESSKELKHLFRKNNFEYRKSVIACALSHTNLYKQLIHDSENDYYIIFEDDAELLPGFKFKLTQVLTKAQSLEFDFLYLGYFLDMNLDFEKSNLNPKDIKLQHYSNRLNPAGLFAYMISKRGAAKVWSHLDKFGFKCAIDDLVQNHCSDINLISYELVPHLVRSDWVRQGNNVDSDIQRDYSKLF